VLEIFPFTESPYKAEYGGKERVVPTDNRARRHMGVTFSQGNRCKELFRLRYATQGDGFVRWIVEPTDNLALPEEKGAYEREGKSLTYRFEPQPGKTVSMDVEIYGGFDAGHRDWHYHLPTNMNCRRYRFTRDLNSYLKAGYQVTKPPAMYFSPEDRECGKLCKIPDGIAPLPYKTPRVDGVWTWELEEMRIGVLYLEWDLAVQQTQVPAATGS
jgi:hypothetical protein